MGKFKNAAGKSEAPPAEANLEPEEQLEEKEAEALAPEEALAAKETTPAPIVADGIAQDVEPEAPPAQKMNRKYRVIGGPASVMYNGQRINVTPGKVFIEHSVDLEHLRSQGIILQLIPDVTSVMGVS